MILYRLVIRLLAVGVWLASWFQPKARLFYNGRKNFFPRLKKALEGNTAPLVWIHCASLGEFEQGRPIIESLKKEFPSYRILLTFFSPSGYEVRKNHPLADYIFYLPLDTRAHAKMFVEITNPQLAIFVKYEFWYHYSEELHKRNIHLISISAIFRKNQLFFRKYGWVFRKMLGFFQHFFVQNAESVALLNSIGIAHVTLAGDTRFDRVHAITRQAEEIEMVSRFKGNDRVMVVGSCWQEDLHALAPFINEGQLKFILAPHEISPSFLADIERQLEVPSKRYSHVKEGDDIASIQVLLIDNMGMLSRLYRYGEFAFIGGAFGKGLHNILEAACYGVPVFFGNKNYQKFQEANDLIMRGGAFEVSGFAELKQKFEMVNVAETFLLACEVTRSYVEENLGATDKIMAHCRHILKA